MTFAQKGFSIFTVLFLLGSTLAQAAPTVSGCTQTADDGVKDSKDIKAVLSKINGDYANFESDVEWESGENLPSSFQDHFSNGNYECEYHPSGFDACTSGDLAERDVFGNLFICDAFLDDIHEESQKDRRACEAGLIAGYHARAYIQINPSEALKIAKAAFHYWEDRFGSTIDFEECGNISYY